MTDDTDFVRLSLSIGDVNILLSKLKMTWPPPPYIFNAEAGGFIEMSEAQVNRLHPAEMEFLMERISMSRITDEEIDEMDHIARGAEYKYVQSAT